MSNVVTRQKAIQLLWERGSLEYKLNQGQKDIYDLIHRPDKKIITVSLSRRFGKSFVLCLISIETCLKNPNSTVIFICPTQQQVMKNLKSIMLDVLVDCPEHLKPTFKRNDGLYAFPNGSEIRLAGVDDGNHENLRGAKADLCVVDEAGFCADLQYVVQSVLLPTTSTTRGKVILISTPSRSPDHDFVHHYMRMAKEDGSLMIKTIYENPNIPDDEKQLIIDSYPGGISNSEFQREYLCITKADAEYSVIPEFSEKESELIKDWVKPEFYDTYVSMDPGGSDFTGVLFGYYDFINAAVVIEDELFIPGTKYTTQELSELIKDKESEAFYNPISEITSSTYKRVSDNNNLTLLHDLVIQYGLHFLTTRKDNKQASINTVRTLVGQEKLIINPRCTNLISQLKGCTWNRKKTDFERSANGSHYDLISSLIYLVRNIDFNKNPNPFGYDTRGYDFIRNPKEGGKMDIKEGLRTIFKLGKKK